VGSDVPDLPANILADAIASLKSSGAVIAPAADGGYYLLGFRQDFFCEAVFQDISWSTNRVFQQTMTLFKQKKIPVTILPQWWDIDDLIDLKGLMERNSKTEFSQSRTMKFLRDHLDPSSPLFSPEIVPSATKST